MSIAGSLKNIRDTFSHLVKDNKKQREVDDSDELNASTRAESVDDMGHTFRDFYPVNPPFGYIGIEMDEKNGKLRYITVEPTLNKEETGILNELKDGIIERMDIPLTYLNNTESMEEYLR